MKLTIRKAACAALSAAILLGAANPGHAQASPIASGGGAFVAFNQETHLFSFSVVEAPDGSVTGHAMVHEPVTNSFVRIELTSFMYLGDKVAAAGPITMAVNAPPHFVVGATGFFAVSDNGRTSPPADEFAGTGVAPLSFGDLTIQQIIALFGPPPPEAYRPLIAGNIKIH